MSHYYGTTLLFVYVPVTNQGYAFDMQAVGTRGNMLVFIKHVLKEINFNITSISTWCIICTELGRHLGSYVIHWKFSCRDASIVVKVASCTTCRNDNCSGATSNGNVGVMTTLDISWLELTLQSPFQYTKWPNMALIYIRWSVCLQMHQPLTLLDHLQPEI